MIVIGVQDEHIQRRLLAERELTFARALELAQSLERAAENVTTLQQGKGAGASPQLEEVHKVQGRGPFRGRPSKPWDRESQSPCIRCGKSNHTPATCKFKTAKCHGCGKIGHIKRACLSRDKPSHTPRKTPGDVRRVEEEQGEDEYTLFNVPSSKKSKPYVITLEVERQQLKMEIDTGASLSLVSEDTREKLWPNKRLLPTTAKLRTYSGQELSIKGTLKVKVRHNSWS